jgi:hypothetical protein
VQSFSDIEVVADYSFAIGIDNGIIAARNLSQVLNIEYGLISYEIYCDDELNNLQDKINKAQASQSCKDLLFAVVQDKARAKLLMEEYSVVSDKLLYMPVAGQETVPYQISYRLHDHLNLPHDTKILLHTGSVGSWTMTDWAVEKAISLPPNWVLVIHNRNVEDKRSKSSKVLYTNLPNLPFSEMQSLMQSATCSLGLYKSIKGSEYTGKNIEQIGLSSSKISLSLQYGIPVLVNEIGEMAELIRTYNAGFVIDVNSNFPFKVLEDLTDKNSSQNCHKLFSELLDMRRFSGKIFEMIDASVLNKKSIAINHVFLKDRKHKLVADFELLPAKQQFSVLKRMTSKFITRVKQSIFFQ